ncbi:MAG: acyl carrier protein [Ruminococcus sp.]|nr:acyl carrier protein [Ruminococcus sp.]
MLEKIRELICNYVEVEPEEITENSRFMEDLNMNSYDFMCLLGDLEAEFDVTVDESEILEIHTIGEAIVYLENLKK